MKKEKILWPIILGFSIIVIFVLGIFMVRGINNGIDKIDLDNKAAIKKIVGDGKITYLKDGTVKEDNDNYVKAVYKIVNPSGEITSYAYFVCTKGFKAGFNLLVCIDAKSQEIINIAYGEYQETYLDDITDEFLAQFINKSISESNFQFDIGSVSGATRSSQAMIRAAELARKQYYIDINEELPTNPITVESVKQSTSDYEKYNVSVKIGNDTYTLVCSYNEGTKVFTYISGGDDLAAADIATIVSLAKPKLPSNRITNVVVEGDKLVLTIQASGFGGSIVAEVTTENGAVTGFIVKSQNESYEEDGGYSPASGDPLTDLPNSLIAAGSGYETVGAISGATITSNAIKAIFKMAMEYTGGNA